MATRKLRPAPSLCSGRGRGGAIHQLTAPCSPRYKLPRRGLWTSVFGKDSDTIGYSDTGLLTGYGEIKNAVVNGNKSNWASDYKGVKTTLCRAREEVGQHSQEQEGRRTDTRPFSFH
ncbi:hypothetical protein AV530_004865 [Patagioenas fasciata monilis]|uniref:Uncharacterized protein n=1 Tax=Patagioenas fasciata monilis TaxID=372326 RepID=A0A1V4KE76_PATFA|nr:hypothetical protein AV530_004865 [Patagioenas fasciata monilis]